MSFSAFVIVAALATTAEPLSVVSFTGPVKLGPGSTVPADVRLLTLARGECEAFQLRVAPEATGIAVKAEPFKSGTTTLESTVFRQEYLNVTTPSNIEGKVGAWPDALV